MTLLRDLPGGPEFCESAARAVADMALAFAGESDDRVLAHLHGGRLGAEAARLVVDAIIAGVMQRKAEIESTPRGTA